jgi:Spy/CpxP family protein refolding chaperone
MMTLVAKWRIVLYLVAIFSAGAVSGWVLSAKRAKEEVYSPPPFEKFSSSLRNRLHARLNLTTNQASRIDAIIEKSSREMQSIHSDCQRRFRQGLINRNAQITAVLTSEQQTIFEQMERERREAWNRRGTRDHRRGPRESSNNPSSTNLSSSRPR